LSERKKAKDSDKLWKANGRPRSSPIYDKRNADKREFKACIRRGRAESLEAYSNDLNDALLSKNGEEFWKCWNTKLGKKLSNPKQVNGLSDNQLIANKFYDYFSEVYSSDNCDVVDVARSYDSMRQGYIGAPLSKDQLFDAELVETIICDLKRGKAAGLDGLTAEHLQHCLHLLPCILAKLFNLMLLHSYVPKSFGLSYTIPIPKGNGNKSLSTSDFRGISISPVLSKVFEHCVYIRFNEYFSTSHNQFGFKKSFGCSHAIYSLRCIVDRYTGSASTVNLCAMDISKAFDKMNHAGLFVKLMKRLIPVKLLTVIENWFSKSFTCVRWVSVYSMFFKLECGVRQGGVLSPHLFAVYIDDIVNSVNSCGSGCYKGQFFLNIILHADDIILLAPSVEGLQKLFTLCENELIALGMSINEKKTVCMRIGTRFKNYCAKIVTSTNKELSWVNEIRYLGVYIISFVRFKCNFDGNKKSFFRSFNSVYGRGGGKISEETILFLVQSKCMPVLLYGIDVCPVTIAQIRSFEFTVNRTLIKVYKTTPFEFINE